MGSAQGLLNGIGGIEAIYQNLDKIAELDFRGAKTLGKKMAEYEEQARLSYKLATIDVDLNLDYSPQTLTPEQADTDKLADLYSEYEFKRWYTEVTSSQATPAAANSDTQSKDTDEEEVAASDIETDYT